MVALGPIHAQELQDRGLRGKGVTVGLVGTGIDLNHPDFANINIRAFSVPGVGNDTGDTFGHETGVAWVISRIAPAARLIVVKVQANKDGYLSDVIDGCEILRTAYVDIVNLSIATDGDADGLDPIAREADFLVNQGMIVVAAAGNKGPKKHSIGSPGAAKNVITVGKVDGRNFVTRDSSRGPTLDGRMKPDCVAPGVDIVAAVPLAMHALHGLYNCTSFSAPHVTGILALLKEAYPHAKPALLKQAIMETCTPVTTLFSFHPDPNTCGAGLVNGSKAYEWMQIYGLG